eukprot:6835958-Prymnesium_polylepis.1
MSETFDGPGEDGVTVMQYDRSIETGSALYMAFVPYALVMLVIYPIGARSNQRPHTPAFCSASYSTPTPAEPRLRCPMAGIPLQYATLLARNHTQLHELRVVEMSINEGYEIAKLDAEAAETEEQAAE